MFNNTGAVSADVRDRVLKVADRLRYGAARRSMTNYIALAYTGPSSISSPYDSAIMEGVSEASIIGMAAGLALEGKIVYVNTIATFLTRRCFEQVVLVDASHVLLQCFKFDQPALVVDAGWSWWVGKLPPRVLVVACAHGCSAGARM